MAARAFHEIGYVSRFMIPFLETGQWVGKCYMSTLKVPRRCRGTWLDLGVEAVDAARAAVLTL